MLQAINDRIKGWLGIAIVALIALPFTFFGIQSYIGSGGETFAAKVNDIEISTRKLDENVSIQRQKLQQQFGGKVPFEDAVLKQQVLDQLVNKTLLEDATLQSGYRISDTQLAKNIKKIFTRDGKFDRDYLNQLLQSRGMSKAQLEQLLRDEMRITQLMDGLSGTSFVSDSEVRQLAELEYQQRKISTLTFSVDSFSDGIEVSEDEIMAAYQAESDRYMRPEEVSVEYVELKVETLAIGIEVEEQAIATMYDEYVASMSKKEQRKAKHILLKTDQDAAAARAKLLDISEQIAEGTSFDDLARKHSQDVGSAKQGGDLGWVEAGQMVKPFEDALYALKTGAVSGVVESEFGLHLIKLEEVRSEPVAPLSDKKAELELAYKKEKASDKFYDLRESMATTAYETPDTLENVAEALSIQVEISEDFTSNSGSDIATHSKVREAAFSSLVLEEKSNSDVIEISPEHVIVLRVHEHKPASLQPLETVHSVIENSLRLKKNHEATLVAARSVKDKINAGSALEDVVAEGITLEQSELLTRKDTQKIDSMILQAAFDMAVPEEGKVLVDDVAMFSGDVALVVLQEVQTPSDIGQDKIDMIKSQWLRDLSNQEFGMALNTMKDNASIRINKKTLQ